MEQPHELTEGTWRGKWIIVNDALPKRRLTADPQGVPPTDRNFGDCWIGDRWDRQYHFAKLFDSRAEAVTYLEAHRHRM
jgi:hypothetical protein